MNLYFKKFFSLRHLILLFGVLIFLSGCDKELTETQEDKVLKKLSIQDRELIAATNNLSLDILKTEFSQNADENSFFSPVSVGMALGMVYNGVGESEKSQIRHIMGLESMAQNEINKSYNELLSFLQVSENHLDISYANSLWFSDELEVQENFESRIMAYYDAEISGLDFKKHSSFDLINSWGNLKTGGKIGKLINHIPAIGTDIFLINAMNLDAAWSQSSNSFLTKGEFRSTQGTLTKINKINWDGLNVKWSEAQNFLEIPMENKQFSLALVQPQQENISDFLASFSMDELAFMTETTDEYQANVSIPNINFASDKPLKATLSGMGLNELFLASTDLSPSFVEKNKQISEINHIAKINFKKPLQSMESEISFTNPNLKTIDIDRPFLYFVRDKYTKTVLFAGYFSTPQE